ncbi:sirohydrochlorin chelatase [Gordonia sp. HY002]|uniref:sirohydrochlorin chelatase n=1 Tax=Gordonia zhenghanii TaxID=2911516 RepID=UPI001F31BBB3|nr:CbiX/SirB N-terminal domain-containing protein [Gordonia zhenghanii]MCF8570951.1 sirohydrochlorin chelatase [Gordonia zhenghanii]
MSTTLVLAAHGSRDPRFDATARRVADAVRVGLPGVRVELAYLDLTEPLIGDVLARLSGDAVVVPLLFGNGFHGKIDLPAMLADASASNPALSVRQTEVVGVHSPVPALVDRLTEAGLSDDDGVLMIAVGSSDPTSDASITARSDELAAALGRPVELVFATRIGHDGSVVRDAVDALLARGCSRIALSPLFVSAGLLTERVERVLDSLDAPALVAGPVGAHPTLVDAIAALYTAHAAVAPAVSA